MHAACSLPDNRYFLHQLLFWFLRSNWAFLCDWVPFCVEDIPKKSWQISFRFLYLSAQLVFSFAGSSHNAFCICCVVIKKKQLATSRREMICSFPSAAASLPEERESFSKESQLENTSRRNLHGECACVIGGTNKFSPVCLNSCLSLFTRCHHSFRLNTLEVVASWPFISNVFFKHSGCTGLYPFPSGYFLLLITVFLALEVFLHSASAKNWSQFNLNFPLVRQTTRKQSSGLCQSNFIHFGGEWEYRHLKHTEQG